MTLVIWNILAFIIAISILVAFHEFGHFWVARKCGVKVERFSIGFGKALWRRYDKHGTEFVIAAIPLGGYVKMLDERVDEVAEQDKKYTFNSKSVYQRIAIIAAGPIANFVLAVFAFYVMFLIGVTSVKPVISDTQANSIAAQAGLTGTHEITQVDGETVKNWQDVNLALVSAIGHQTLTISAQREGTNYNKEYRLDIRHWQFSPDTQSAIDTLGLIPYQPKTYSEIVLVQKDSAADKAGLKVGDKLVKINNIDVEDNWPLFASTIKSFANKTVELQLVRDGTRISILATPTARTVNGKKVGYMGISPKRDAYPENYIITIQYGFVDAIAESFAKTWQTSKLILSMLKKLLLGDISLDNLSGPISIAQGAGASAGIGLVYFLGFLAFFSINLGIINLLPLPVLDGGHLLYYLIELFTGKPVPEKVQETGFKIGAMILLTIMGIGILNDLSRL